MAIQYEPLSTVTLAYAQCAHPPKVPGVLRLEDNALMGMVDYQYFEPNTIFEDERLEVILEEITRNPLHVLLVTDASHHVVGILRSEDVQDTAPYQIMEEKGVKREKITAKMLMKHYKEVLTFDINDVKNVRVGNVMVTLEAQKKHYALVQETPEGSDKTFIRGLYSLSQLKNALGEDL